jgi:CRISPR system Cascade subunit CasE
MTLHMIRLDPNVFAASRWGASQRVTREGTDDGYLWHALLKAAFGDHAPKPFRVVMPEHRPAYLVGYGAADKPTLLQHALSFADPAATEALGLDTLALKAMPAAFDSGQRLGFEVRVRPVIRTTRNDSHGRPGREVDAFLAAAHGSTDTLNRAQVYAAWLARAMGPCVALTGARPVAMRRARLLRRGAADEAGQRALAVGGAKGGGPDVTMRGELTVTDPAGFSALLARGVGRHRAFGFGMLLLMPPGREIG